MQSLVASAFALQEACPLLEPLYCVVLCGSPAMAILVGEKVGVAVCAHSGALLTHITVLISAGSRVKAGAAGGKDG